MEEVLPEISDKFASITLEVISILELSFSLGINNIEIDVSFYKDDFRECDNYPKLHDIFLRNISPEFIECLINSNSDNNYVKEILSKYLKDLEVIYNSFLSNLIENLKLSKYFIVSKLCNIGRYISIFKTEELLNSYIKVNTYLKNETYVY